MIQTKRVHGEAIAEQAFGWEIVGEGQTTTQSYTHHARGRRHSHTQYHHYYDLARDTNTVKNFHELTLLEEEYHSVSEPPPMPVKISGGIVLIGILLCLLPGIIMLIFNTVIYGKKLRERERSIAELDAKKAQIIMRARKLQR